MNSNVHPIIIVLTLSIDREREKLSQREELWQQVESLAKTNPEWSKARRFNDCRSPNESRNLYNEYNENCDLLYEQQNEQQARQPPPPLPTQKQALQEPREVRQALATLTTLNNY